MRVGDVTINPAGFLLYPADWLAACGLTDLERVRQVYYAALAQARDLHRPAIMEPLFASAWN
jgi:hypothetical protein